MCKELENAFREMFPTAEAPTAFFVTLYEVKSLYGGPEEGGWWYDWYTPIATKQVSSEFEADTIRTQIRTRAAQMQRDAAKEWANSMRESCDWAEARGIDPADMDEPDGPDNFKVFTEEFPGQYRTTERPYYS